MTRKRTRPTPEPEPESRRVALGDTLFRCSGRARDQADPVPGTKWEEVATGCELIASDLALYVRFLNGAPAPHWRQP